MPCAWGRGEDCWAGVGSGADEKGSGQADETVSMNGYLYEKELVFDE